MNILKKLRLEKGYSLNQLAKLARVDQSTISLLENDKQRGQERTLGKLAVALEVPIEDLLILAETDRSERGKAAIAIRYQKQKMGGLVAAL